MNKANTVKIIQYKWEGSWGPFRIKILCGECAVTEGVIKDVLEYEFAGKDISFEVLPWLSNWWKPFFHGGWHAPIVTVNDKVIFQGEVLDRGLLAYHIRKELVKTTKITGTVMFSKEGCGHCARAKKLMDEKGIKYENKDVVKDPMATEELFFLTKRFFPKNKPVTTPQIWIDGKYVGGEEELIKYFL